MLFWQIRLLFSIAKNNAVKSLTSKVCSKQFFQEAVKNGNTKASSQKKYKLPKLKWIHYSVLKTWFCFALLCFSSLATFGKFNMLTDLEWKRKCVSWIGKAKMVFQYHRLVMNSEKSKSGSDSKTTYFPY